MNNSNQPRLLLNRIQVDFLLDNFLEEINLPFISKEILENRILEKGFPTDRFYLEVSDEERNQLLDSLTFLLTAEGIDKTGEVNCKGSFVEGLIDQIITSQ